MDGVRGEAGRGGMWDRVRDEVDWWGVGVGAR